MPRGRSAGAPPTKASPARMKAILRALQVGNYQTTACKLAGVSAVTHHAWRGRGEKELDRVEAELALDNIEEYLLGLFDGKVNPKEKDSPSKDGFDYMLEHRPEGFLAKEWLYVCYAIHVDRAKATAEFTALQAVRGAFGTSWQAAAWYLERTQPDKYGRRERINHEGPEHGSPVRVSVESLEQKLMGDG